MPLVNDDARDAEEARMAADIATNQRYVDNLLRALGQKGLTPAKRASLAASHARHADKLMRMTRAFEAWKADHPDLDDVVAIDIGDDPIEMDTQPLPSNTFYDCPDDFDPEEFEALHGYTVQTYYDKIYTAVLRPNLDTWQKLVSKESGFTQQMANWYKAGWVRKQQSALDYANGEIPFQELLSYLGGDADEFLGCIDIEAIKDLGAAGL